MSSQGAVRRVALIAAVVAVLVGLVVVAPPSSVRAAPGPGDAVAPVDPALEAKAEDGEVRVIAVTAAPGEQVVDDVVAAAPHGSLSDVSAGAAHHVVATVDAEGLDALRSAPGVTQVVEDKVNHLTDDSWPTAIGLELPRELGYDGDGRTIAVLDSGVQATHPFLGGRVIAEACFSTTSLGTESLCSGHSGDVGVPDAFGSGAAAPCTGISGCSHGTHVAGLAVGRSITSPAPLTGTASGASLIAVKVFSKGTSSAICGSAPPCLVAYDSDIAEALVWLLQLMEDGDPLVATLDVVNLSLGGGLYAGTCDASSPLLASVFGAVRSAGVVPVVATGNNGVRGRVASPACLSSVVSVGATTGTGSVASFSNVSATTTLLAPGASMTSSIAGSSYGSMSGTSMAAPLVSGAVALLREQNPSFGVTSIVNRLTMTATNIASPVGTLKELQLDAAVAGVPGDVSAITTAPGFRAVNVSWGAPTYAGSPAVNSYTVTASPGGATCTVAAPVRTCRVAGLANGTTYTFRVTASNSVGAGAGTTASAAPKGLPGVQPFGSLDVVSAGVGKVTVGGWALDPETDASIAVHVYVDAAGTAITADGNRPDVDAVYGYGPAHGFSRTITTTGGPHTVCAYAINAAGTGGGNTLLGCKAVTVPTGSPFGGFDVAAIGPRSITVGGWAIDPDTEAPIPVHVYVDSVGTAHTAGGYRSDLASVFGPYTGNHAFNAKVSATPGTHTVCAYAINTVGSGGNVLLGCKVVTVMTGSPIGSLDVATRNLGGGATVGGWALDWDQVEPVAVHVYVTAPGQPTTAFAITADGVRSDIAALVPVYTGAHGFLATTPGPVPAGATVCAYGINVGAGGNSLLGCRVVP